MFNVFKLSVWIGGFLFLVITAGCIGIGGDPTTEQFEPTPSETSDKSTTDSRNMDSETSSHSATLSSQQQLYLESGRSLMQVVGARFQQVHQMDAVSRDVYPNNTVKMTIRLNDGDPLYMGIMNVTQTFSVILSVRTTPDREIAMKNGSSGKLYRPEMIYVDVQNSNGSFVGSFEIDPEMAVNYRLGKFDPDIFAENIKNTLEIKQQWKRGSHPPGWYLNRSQLVDWVRVYKSILRNETDPSNTVYNKKFPIENISFYPSEMRVNFEVFWDQDKMGTGFVSAEADMHTAYWKATDRAWAMAPLRLSHYIERPEVDDIRAHMDLDSVYWLLKRPKNTTNISHYLNMIEGGPIEDE